MGNLPLHSVRPTLPFSIFGTDYTGPFLVRPMRGRGIKRFSVTYVFLFVSQPRQFI